MQWTCQDTGYLWYCVGSLVSSSISAPMVVSSLAGTTMGATSLSIQYAIPQIHTYTRVYIYIHTHFEEIKTLLPYLFSYHLFV